MLRLPIFGLLLGIVLAAMPAGAQDDAAAAWQSVITQQVEAFRVNDGATALSFATASIRENYPDPQVFVQFIKNDGYDPIVDSRAHSFGPYKMVGTDKVVQDVKFIADDQGLYEAQYWMRLEDDGWRVVRVHLMHTPGVGV